MKEIILALLLIMGYIVAVIVGLFVAFSIISYLVG